MKRGFGWFSHNFIVYVQFINEFIRLHAIGYVLAFNSYFD